MAPCLCCIRPKVVPDPDDLPKVGPQLEPLNGPIHLVDEAETRQLGTRESLGRLHSILREIEQQETARVDSVVAVSAGPSSVPVPLPEAQPPLSQSPTSSRSSQSSPSTPFLNIFEEASYHLAKLQKAADLSPDLEPIVTETFQKLEALHKVHGAVEALHDIQAALLKVHNTMLALQPGPGEAATKKKSKDPLQAALDKVLKNVAKELEKARTATDQALVATNTATRDSLRVSIIQMNSTLEGRPSLLPGLAKSPTAPSSRRASELAKPLTVPSSRRASESSSSRQPSRAVASDPLLSTVSEEPVDLDDDIAAEASELERDAEQTKSRLESIAKELLTDFVAEARRSISEAQAEEGVVNADPAIEATIAEITDPASEPNGLAEEPIAPSPDGIDTANDTPTGVPSSPPTDTNGEPSEPQNSGGRTPQSGSPTVPAGENEGSTNAQRQPRFSLDPGQD